MKFWFVPYVTLLSLCMMTPSSVQSAEWSSWITLGTKNSVRLSYQYRHKKKCTDVRYKAKNLGATKVQASVVNKVYSCATGGVDKRGSETIGFPMKKNETSGTIPDSCVCDGKGGVSGVKVDLSVKGSR